MAMYMMVMRLINSSRASWALPYCPCDSPDLDDSQLPVDTLFEMLNPPVKLKHGLKCLPDDRQPLQRRQTIHARFDSLQLRDACCGFVISARGIGHGGVPPASENEIDQLPDRGGPQRRVVGLDARNGSLHEPRPAIIVGVVPHVLGVKFVLPMPLKCLLRSAQTNPLGQLVVEPLVDLFGMRSRVGVLELVGDGLGAVELGHDMAELLQGQRIRRGGRAVRRGRGHRGRGGSSLEGVSLQKRSRRGRRRDGRKLGLL